MALSTNAFSASDFAASISESWSPIINEAKFPDAVFTNFCLDLTQYVDGDIVHVPDLYTNQLTVREQSVEGTEITPDSPAQVDDTITVTTHDYVAWLMGDNTMAQVARVYNLNEAYARQAKGLLMNTIEGDIAALWSSLSTTAVGDTSTGLTDADIRRAISTLESANFRTSEMAFFIHPEVFYTQVLGISKYFTYDTSQFDALMSGTLGSEGRIDMGMKHRFKGNLYGIPVFTTTNIVDSLQTYRNMLLTPNAFAWAVQPDFGGSVVTEFGAQNLPIRFQASYELRNLATLAVADFVHGQGVLRAEAGVVLNSSDAYVTS